MYLMESTLHRKLFSSITRKKEELNLGFYNFGAKVGVSMSDRIQLSWRVHRAGGLGNLRVGSV
jgi:hypothetical protein